MVVQWESRAKEICALFASDVRSHVEIGIKIGALLDAQRQDFAKGEFEQWVNDKLPFSLRSAYHYLDLWEYRTKLQSLQFCKDAYELIADLKSKEKVEKKEHNEKLIQDFEKTGEKGADWNRGTDYELQKRQDDTIALSEANQAGEINEGEAIEKEVLLDYKDVIDEEYEQAQKEKAHQKARRGLLAQIDEYLKTYPDDLGYLEAHLLDKKMQLPHPRTDAEIEKIMENFAY